MMKYQGDIWKRVLLSVTMILMAFIFSACGGGGGDGGGGSPAPTTGSLRVTNSTGSSILYLYVSPTSSSSWGSDRLGSSILSNGSSFTVTSLTAGTYDVMVTLSNGTSLYSASPVTVTAGATATYTFTSSTSTGSLRITNSTGSTILYLYVKPTSSSSWGSDRLGSSILSNGSSFTVTSLTAGTYNVRATLSDGTNLDSLSPVTVTSGLTATYTVTSSSSATGSVRVTNSGPLSIWYVYISLSSSGSWGSDLLGAGTIPTGSSQTFTGFTPGTYDIKIVKSDGGVGYDYGFSIVAGQTKVFTVSWKALSDAVSTPEEPKPDTVVEGGEKVPPDANALNLEVSD